MMMVHFVGRHCRLIYVNCRCIKPLMNVVVCGYSYLFAARTSINEHIEWCATLKGAPLTLLEKLSLPATETVLGTTVGNECI